METKVKVKKELHSFLYEIGRFSMTSKFHYTIREKDGEIEIEHHNGKWLVIVRPRVIIVKAGNNVLIIKNIMLLNGKEVQELCELRCYGRREIVEKIVFAILLYRSYNDTLKWLYRWISG
jgi:hypothetical protein